MLLAALALATSLGAAGGAPAARSDSISGTWKITGDVMGNPLNQTCTLTRTDAAITGQCTAEGGASPAQVAGEAKEGKISFWHGADYNGETLTIIYTLTSAAPAKLEGTVLVKPFEVTGTFSAAPAVAK